MLIGITGKAGSGKDTTAEIMGCSLKLRKIAFAEPMKTFCKQVYDWTEEHVNGSLKEIEDKRYPRPQASLHWYELPFAWFYKKVKKKEYLPRGPHYLTPRFAMQQLGTEWGRNCFSNTWIDLAKRKWSKIREDGYSVAVTDVRFLNEAEAISEDAGWLVKVVRNKEVTSNFHKSESELTNIEADFQIENNASLADLKCSISNFLNLVRSLEVQSNDSVPSV